MSLTAANIPRPKKPERQFAVIGVVPEKRTFTRALLETLPSHFWGQPVESSQSIDGIATIAPGEGSPLPLMATSGLSRVQFLVASQSLTIPCFPTYCKDQGGLVVDRVLVHAGGDDWWSTLSGRVRVQNLMTNSQDSRFVDSLKDASNYLMCSNTKLSLGRGTTLKCKVEVDGRGYRGSRSDGSTSSPSCSTSSPPTPLLAASAQLRRKLGARSELNAEGGVNRRMASADGRLATVPVSASVDVGTPVNAPSAFLYRVGMHHQASFPLGKSGITGPPGGGGGGGGGDRHSSHLHLQAGAALQGEKTVWCFRPTPRTPAGDAFSATSGRTLDERRRGLPLYGMGSTGTAAAPLSASRIGPHNPLRSLGKMFRSAMNSAKQQQQEVGDQDLDAPAGGMRGRGEAGGGGVVVGAASGPGGGGGSDGNGGKLFHPDQVQEVLMDSAQSISRLREDVQGLTKWVDSGCLVEQLEKLKGKGGHPHKGRGGGGGKSGGGADGAKASTQPPKGSGALAAVTASSPSPPRSRGGGWSAMLPTSHFKVGGVIGLIAKGCLHVHPHGGHHHRHHGPSGEAAAASAHQEGEVLATASSSAPGGERVGERPEEDSDNRPSVIRGHRPAPTTPGPPSQSGGGGGRGGAAQRATRAFRTSMDWLRQSSTRGGDTTQGGGGAASAAAAAAAAAGLRPFASGAAQLQLGSMQRSFLGFTRIMAKADVGLPPSRLFLLHNPAAAGQSLAATGPSSSTPVTEGFTSGPLEGGQQQQLNSREGVSRGPSGGFRATHHTLTLSLCQQLVGPVRLCFDCRYALESTRPLFSPPKSPPAPTEGRASMGDKKKSGSSAPKTTSSGKKTTGGNNGPTASTAGGSQGSRGGGGNALHRAGESASQLVAHVAGMRPSLVDATYGLDVGLPASSGMVRLVAWHSPGRKEGMVEVRLF